MTIDGWGLFPVAGEEQLIGGADGRRNQKVETVDDDDDNKINKEEEEEAVFVKLTRKCRPDLVNWIFIMSHSEEAEAAEKFNWLWLLDDLTLNELEWMELYLYLIRTVTVELFGNYSIQMY